MTMTMPPMVMRLYIVSPSRRPVNLWLPLFLLWPLVAILLALPILLAVLVDAVLWLSGQRYHHYSALIVRALGLFGDMKGTVIRFNDGDTTVDVTVD